MILTLLEKIQRTSDCYSFLFKPQATLTWKAGQFMQFSLPHENPDDRGINRFFTICSAPHEKVVMITTRYAGENSSTFKKGLLTIEKGVQITALVPQGEFTIEDVSKSYVLLAGGIGITPFRSILLDLEHKQDLNKTSVVLLYSNRSGEIVFKDEFDLLANNNPSFKVRYIIHPEMCDLNLIKVAVPHYDQKTFYISGPPAMVKAMEEGLRSDGLLEEQLKLDYFPGY